MIFGGIFWLFIIFLSIVYWRRKKYEEECKKYLDMPGSPRNAEECGLFIRKRVEFRNRLHSLIDENRYNEDPDFWKNAVQTLVEQYKRYGIEMSKVETDISLKDHNVWVLCRKAGIF